MQLARLKTKVNPIRNAALKKKGESQVYETRPTHFKKKKEKEKKKESKA